MKHITFIILLIALSVFCVADYTKDQSVKMSYSDMRDFLIIDQTDKTPYDIDRYNCVDYSKEIKEKAMDFGLICYPAVLHYPDRAHMILVFETSDAGKVFVEPQSDERVYPVVGEYFYGSGPIEEITYY